MYDITSCPAAWPHVPSRGLVTTAYWGGVCLLMHTRGTAYYCVRESAYYCLLEGVYLLGEGYNKHPLLPQYNHLLPLQLPRKLQPEALQQQPAPGRRHLQLQMFNHQLAELMSHLTDLVMSVRHHNTLLNMCKYIHDNVTG